MGEIFIVKHGDKLYPQVLSLRQLILRDPLAMVFSAEELENDKVFIYFAYVEDGEVLGTVGLEGLSKEKAQLRQMAVHDKLQGKGVGRQLVAFLENYCREQGYVEVHLDSRYTARGFYSRLGYSEYGEIYDKISIKHIDMMKRL